MDYFKNIIHERKIKRFFNASIKNLKCINYTKVKLQAPLHIITVTFNNELLLQKQIDLLKKNVLDEFVFIVADNSSNTKKRKLISEICKENQIVYIPLPLNPFASSDSHAACLNLLYNKYIKVEKPVYFGFIDHDIFAIQPHSIIDYLKKQPIYGHKQERTDYWYLWAGFCFFNYEKIKGYEIDFSTSIINDIWLDTGGANFNSLYVNLKPEDLEFPTHQYIDLREGNSIQSQKVEIIGDWLHSFNGSYWMEMSPKEQILMDYLNKYY